ncbi:GFA family protein [Pseudochrobactrum algeriensis]|uniref:GFA family protein n=1 Tax=Pseudochrobactrum TaxID=354349 RepID=UPI0003B6A6A1|nr:MULTISPECIES: GFA family protein [Pseudochrobactrum]MBX8811245.1 GFA family protein [Ochrobactrum sp. MR34]MDP8249663.1 GFA family protein [Pseudochrobactrum saccharolyticum]QVQ38417.1 GFA family protein [Pseudochrobactrum algeriensis]QVQ41634.1 GFA family protein [Pseudochrobactrum algeriensis]QVQ45561.1 GFA family protein [Pseudochrobactrum algeriensis]
MKTPQLPFSGQCRCGKVRIEVSAAPIMTAACHCTGCQTMSSSAFSLTAMIPSSGFKVTEGKPVIGGLHGPQQHHYFCAYCMTWMFTRIEGVDAFVNVRPSLFDDHSWFVPFVETMTKEKLSWAQTPALYHYEAFPPLEDYEKLMGEFARQME